MFESVVLRRPVFGDKRLDPGLLAEVLLFYQNVYLILDHGSLISIVNAIGAEALLKLIEDGHVKASFVRENMGTTTAAPLGIPFHRFVAYQLRGKKKKKRIFSKQELIRTALERTQGNPSQTRRIATNLERRIPIEKLEHAAGKPLDILGMAHEDLQDSQYTNAAIRLVLQELVPGFRIPAEWYFRAIETKHGFVVDTNFDLGAVNTEYHRSVPPEHSSITPAYLLTHILDARADIAFAGKHMAELVTSPMASQALWIKFSTMLEKRIQNAQEIELFQHTHLEAGTIRESINSGERTFAEFLDILEEAQKFKEWLKDVHPEIGLLKEYYKAATAKTWADKLPAKTLRFAFFTGLGAIAEAVLPMGGVGTAAADTFILGKFLKGWRPSQFVEEKLSAFTGPE